ncbi:MAG: hypothetical protein RIS92_1989, partial [Verrucomicrobiota bacterium]
MLLHGESVGHSADIVAHCSLEPLLLNAVEGVLAEEIGFCDVRGEDVTKDFSSAFVHVVERGMAVEVFEEKPPKFL